MISAKELILDGDNILAEEVVTTSCPQCPICSEEPVPSLHLHMNQFHPTLDKRRSAQKAGSMLKQYTSYMNGDDRDNSDQSDNSDFKGESSEEEDDEEDEEDEEDESSEGEEEDLKMDNKAAHSFSHRLETYNLVQAFKDWWKDQEKSYGPDRLKYLGISKEVSSSVQSLDSEIRVNDRDIKCLESFHENETYVGYTGGTPMLGCWVPKTNYIFLGISNQEHILQYKNATSDSLQLWRLDEVENSLSFVYTVKAPIFNHFIVYPYPDTDIAHVCISTTGKVIMYALPLTVTNPRHIIDFQPIRQFIISKDSNVEIFTICWSLTDDKISLLGGTDNGFLLKWRVSSSSYTQSSTVVPDQKILAHPGYPLSCIKVCPQDQNLVITTSLDSRLKLWNFHYPNSAFLIKTRALKQMLLCTDLHWFHYWDSIVCMGDHISSNPQQSGNNLYALYKEHRQSGKDPLLLHNSRVVPAESGIDDRIRCFDFSGINSSYVAGFHNGLSCVWNCPEPYSYKKHPVLFDKARYLQCRSGLKETDFFKTHFTCDQDLVNQYWFKLETRFSQSVFPTLRNSNITQKSLNSVTLAKWVDFDHNNKNIVCIGYMNGLIQIIKVPNIQL